MPEYQISISEAVENKLKQQAKNHGLSISQYLEQLIDRGCLKGSWPTGFGKERTGLRGEDSQKPVEGDFDRRTMEQLANLDD